MTRADKIRRDLATTDAPYIHLAAKYGVSRQAVGQLARQAFMDGLKVLPRKKTRGISGKLRELRGPDGLLYRPCAVCGRGIRAKHPSMLARHCSKYCAQRHRATFTDAQASMMRRLHKNGWRTCKISAKFGGPYYTVWSIIRNLAYKNT